MASLFKKNKETVKIKKNFVQKDVLFSFIRAVAEIGEFEDYKVLSSKAAEIFFDENKNLFKSLSNISGDNLNILVDLLNCFFVNYKLGNIEMEIDEDNGEVFITHYHSPFINAFEEQKNCVFLVLFYKKLFEYILNEKLNVKEEECGVNNEKCIFKITV